MKYIFFNGLLCFFSSCALLLSAPTETLGQSNLATYDAIKHACATDSQSIGLAKEKDKEARKLTDAMNGLFLSAGITKESFTFEQMLTYLDKGYAINKEKKLGLKGPKVISFIAAGADGDYKALDSICPPILLTSLKKNSESYPEVIEFPPRSANLTTAKDATVSTITKEHVSKWRAQYPIHFVAYVNKTGDYEVEIEYSKNKAHTSSAPLKIYATTGLDKKSLEKASQLSEKVASTADKSWKTFRTSSLGLLRLEAGKKYYLLLTDTETSSKNKKEVMALHKLKLKGPLRELDTKPYNDSHRALSHACIMDSHDLSTFLHELSKEEQAKRLAAYAGHLSGLFIKAGVTNKNITSKQMLSYYDKGTEKFFKEKKVEYGDGLFVYGYVALAAGFNLEKLEKMCERLTGGRRYDHLEGYSIRIEFPAQHAHLQFTKGAVVRSVDGSPEHVSHWMSGSPVIFKTYIDRTGDYEVEIAYSKSEKGTSTSPLRVYAIKGDRNSPKSGDAVIKAKVPATAKNWKTYKKRTLGKLRLEAGNFYTFYLADDEIKKKKKKNVMALQEMVVRLK